MRQGASLAAKAAPSTKLRAPPPQPYYISYRSGGAYSQLVHSRSPVKGALPTPARNVPDHDSSFNENSPAGIAVNALLMAANAMDVSTKPTDDGDSHSLPPETNDSARDESEDENEAQIESINPKSPDEARRSGMEAKTKDSKNEPQKTAEVSPDDRFNSRKRSMASENPSKSTPDLAFIKKKARSLPTSSSKKLERNVSADDGDNVESDTLDKTRHSPVKTSSIQALL